MVVVKKKPVFDINRKLVYYEVRAYNENGTSPDYYIVSPEGEIAHRC
jgi:hypothetical protein